MSEPRILDKVKLQIRQHPNFGKLPRMVLFQYDYCLTCSRPSSRQWLRQLWRHLYLGTPCPE